MPYIPSPLHAKCTLHVRSSCMKQLLCEFVSNRYMLYVFRNCSKDDGRATYRQLLVFCARWHWCWCSLPHISCSGTCVPSIPSQAAVHHLSYGMRNSAAFVTGNGSQRRSQGSAQFFWQNSRARGMTKTMLLAPKEGCCMRRTLLRRQGPGQGSMMWRPLTAATSKKKGCWRCSRLSTGGRCAAQHNQHRHYITDCPYFMAV